jgi:hypothetical protein
MARSGFRPLPHYRPTATPDHAVIAARPDQRDPYLFSLSLQHLFRSTPGFPQNFFDRSPGPPFSSTPRSSGNVKRCRRARGGSRGPEMLELDTPGWAMRPILSCPAAKRAKPRAATPGIARSDWSQAIWASGSVLDKVVGKVHCGRSPIHRYEFLIINSCRFPAFAPIGDPWRSPTHAGIRAIQ